MSNLDRLEFSQIKLKLKPLRSKSGHKFPNFVQKITKHINYYNIFRAKFMKDIFIDHNYKMKSE